MPFVDKDTPIRTEYERCGTCLSFYMKIRTEEVIWGNCFHDCPKFSKIGTSFLLFDCTEFDVCKFNPSRYKRKEPRCGTCAFLTFEPDHTEEYGMDCVCSIDNEIVSAYNECHINPSRYKRKEPQCGTCFFVEFLPQPTPTTEPEGICCSINKGEIDPVDTCQFNPSRYKRKESPE